MRVSSSQAWAGPWPVDEQWWDEAAARRIARFQVVGVDGSAWLMVVEDGRYTGELSYYAYGENKAEAIRALEDILLGMEGPRAANMRDREKFYFTVFGDPKAGGTWSWRWARCASRTVCAALSRPAPTRAIAACISLKA